MTKSLQTKIGEIGEWLESGSLNAFGRPFAGKDTHLAPLAEAYDTPVLSGGQILREAVIPERVLKIMNSGLLIPTPDYVQIVVPVLEDEELQGKPLLLSAVGKMSGEEEAVMEATEKSGHPTRVVIHFDITADESLRRAAVSPSRNRADDSPEARTKRQEEFDTHTLPVLDFYESEGLLLPIDAMPAQEVVFGTFVHMLHDRAHGRA